MVVEPVMGVGVWGLVALMVVVPALMAVARPWRLVLVTEATVVSEDSQVQDWVIFLVVLSLKVPVAMNCLRRPTLTEGSAGVTAMDTRIALVTVTVVLALMTMAPGMVAVIMAVPPAMAVTFPSMRGELSTVATAVLEELQLTWVVMSRVLPSL